MKIENAIGRSVEEWIGATPNTPVPPRVQLRVFERYGGVCYLSKLVIRAPDKWEVEHIVSLSMGGEHRESNLAPALVGAHKEKTKIDKAVLAKARRTKAKHLGIRGNKKLIPGSKGSGLRKKMDGTVIRVTE